MIFFSECHTFCSQLYKITSYFYLWAFPFSPGRRNLFYFRIIPVMDCGRRFRFSGPRPGEGRFRFRRERFRTSAWPRVTPFRNTSEVMSFSEWLDARRGGWERAFALSLNVPVHESVNFCAAQSIIFHKWRISATGGAFARAVASSARSLRPSPGFAFGGNGNRIARWTSPGGRAGKGRLPGSPRPRRGPGDYPEGLVHFTLFGPFCP